MLFNIWVTQECNLSCKYCYEKEKRKSYLNLEEADQFVEFILKYQTDKLNQVHFHGGEPLLNWNVIKYIIKRINHSSLKMGRFQYSFTTNGIFFTNDMLYFFKENDIQISVSVDGKSETHDKNRIDKRGKGTYYKVKKSLKKLEENGIEYEIRMTFDSQTISELAQNVKFLLENFNFSCLRWAPDLFYCRWNEEKVQILMEQYQNIMEYQKKLKKEQAEKIAFFNKDNFNKLGRCCGGITEINIDTKGDLYPCTYVCGNENFLIGNIKIGLDIDSIKRIHSNMQKSYMKCESCHNNAYCVGNRCKVINYAEDTMSSVYMENLCSLSNAEINLLREQWML